MAIKGKKKPPSRGSQARRRPAAAPRPAYVSRQHVPWYRTRGGMVVAALAVLVVAAMAGAIVVSNRPPAANGNAAKGALETYTSSVQSVLEQLQTPGAQMAAAPRSVAGAADARKLASSAHRWETQLVTAETRMAALQPDPKLETSYQVMTQSAHLLLSAAKTYELAPDVTSGSRNDLLQRAEEQRDQANVLWQTAVGLLDRQRSAAGLAPSGLQAPVPPPSTAPSPSAGGGSSHSGSSGGGNNG